MMILSSCGSGIGISCAIGVRISVEVEEKDNSPLAAEWSIRERVQLPKMNYPPFPNDRDDLVELF